MTRILQHNKPKDAAMLRIPSSEVPATLFGKKKLGGIITKMQEAMRSQDDGIAIAAPQIGINLQIFVVNKSIFTYMKENTTNLPNEEFSKLLEQEEQGREDLVFINPTIIKQSKRKIKMDEGCLSVRPIYGSVLRSEKTQIRAQDISGESFIYGGSGLMSQVFQHEIDHLHGKLFVDTATDLRTES